MPNWINHPLTLQGETVTLTSLKRAHFKDLTELANEKSIWEHYIFDGSNPEKFKGILEIALEERDKGNQFPFTIIQNEDYKIIGSTRFLDLQRTHKKLEIGFTWVHPDHWGTVINLECKLLLLNYCFDMLGTHRVQFKTDENNIRSRKAIVKIGGQFEGIIRNDMIRENQSKRNSACYSITNDEWPEKKSALVKLFKEKLIKPD